MSAMTGQPAHPACTVPVLTKECICTYKSLPGTLSRQSREQQLVKWGGAHCPRHVLESRLPIPGPAPGRFRGPRGMSARSASGRTLFPSRHMTTPWRRLTKPLLPIRRPPRIGCRRKHIQLLLQISHAGVEWSNVKPVRRQGMRSCLQSSCVSSVLVISRQWSQEGIWHGAVGAREIPLARPRVSDGFVKISSKCCSQDIPSMKRLNEHWRTGSGSRLRTGRKKSIGRFSCTTHSTIGSPPERMALLGQKREPFPAPGSPYEYHSWYLVKSSLGILSVYGN